MLLFTHNLPNEIIKSRNNLSPLNSNNRTVKVLKKEGTKYIIIGGINTLFGYIIGVTFLLILDPYLPTYVIGSISTILSIILNFILYKAFVFGFNKKWFFELLRMFQVYAVASIIGVVVLTITKDVLELNAWLSQLCAIVVSVFISALGNYTFTFKRKIF